MSDSPSPGRPIPPPWEREPGGGRAGSDVVDGLRARLRRIALFSVVAVAVLGAAGIVTVVLEQSLATLVAVCVGVGSVLVVVVAGSRAVSATRSLNRAQFDAPAAHFVPAPDPAPVEAVRVVDSTDPDQRREVFVKLARRLQSLVNRAIGQIDTLERDIEDPEILRGLFGVDHLVTRVRRQAENIAVLGGEAPQRRSVKPVSVYAVLRSAVAEIEHYKQISIIGVEGAHLHGHVVAEIIHLLAELLENATTFSAPDSGKVVLRAQKVTAGLAIEVQDRGLGMNSEDLERINHLLDGSTTIDITELLGDGRIGLAVVKQLAGRHHVRVRLQTNVFGGIDAAIVLPHQLLVDPPVEKAAPRPAPQSQAPQEARVPAANLPPAPATYGNDAQRSNNPLPMRQPRQPVASVPQAQPPAQIRSALDGIPAEHTTQSDQAAQPAQPPLPQRRGSYLSPQLREPTSPTRPLPGHTTNLMATVQQGFDRGRTEQEPPAETPQPQHGTTQGESPWPTT
jgi:signal transduction histidine kinase